jgi:hypothetical protein
MINNCSHTTHNLTIAICEELVSLAKLKGCIAVLAERIDSIPIQIGNKTRVTFIEVEVKLYETLKLCFCSNLNYFYRH